MPLNILFLHGSADSPQVFNNISALLRDRHQIHTPAFPPVTTPLALTIDLLWLDQQMRQTGARVLVAHSYGALLALRWALAHPEGLDGLVLAEPIAWGVARHLPDVAARLAELDRECVAQFGSGQPEPPLQWLVDYWNGGGFWAALPPKVRAHLLAGVPRTQAEVASGGADRTSAEELMNLKVPLHLLAGEKTTAESLTIAKIIATTVPRAQLTVIPGVGHQFLRSHAQVVVDSIESTTSARAAVPPI